MPKPVNMRHLMGQQVFEDEIKVQEILMQYKRLRKYKNDGSGQQRGASQRARSKSPRKTGEKCRWASDFMSQMKAMFSSESKGSAEDKSMVYIAPQ
jgi:hypothetical protein